MHKRRIAVVGKPDTVDMKKFTIKPSDIGYDTEAAQELSQPTRRAYGRTAEQRENNNTTNTRPPVMLYPGE